MSGRQRFAAVVRSSVIVGIEDTRAFHTWQTWIFGWMSRVIAQVLFFSVFGRYLGTGDERTLYILVGVSIIISVLDAMGVVMATARDRQLGLLGILVAAPTPYYAAYAFRNVNQIVTGVLASSIALPVSALILGVSLPWHRLPLILPLMIIGTTSAYVFATCLAGMTSQVLRGRWIIMNVPYMLLMIFGGFVIPVTFWPAAVQAIVPVLPYTNALVAVREVLGSDPVWSVVAGRVGVELVVVGAWATLAATAFRLSIAQQRQTGAIDL